MEPGLGVWRPQVSELGHQLRAGTGVPDTRGHDSPWRMVPTRPNRAWEAVNGAWTAPLGDHGCTPQPGDGGGMAMWQQARTPP